MHLQPLIQSHDFIFTSHRFCMTSHSTVTSTTQATSPITQQRLQCTPGLKTWFPRFLTSGNCWINASSAVHCLESALGNRAQRRNLVSCSQRGTKRHVLLALVFHTFFTVCFCLETLATTPKSYSPAPSHLLWQCPVAKQQLQPHFDNATAQQINK